MKVYDVFPFFNEIDLLEIRLEHLDQLVDYFVITEATTTFSGNPKPLYFDENRALFKKFEKKIIHQVVDQIPDLDPFERDRYQRDCVRTILQEHCENEDFIIYGDVDELPSIPSLESSFNYLHVGYNMIHLAQNQYYFYLNVEEVSNSLRSFTGEYPLTINRKWLGTNVSKWEYARQFSITNLRDPIHKENGKRLKNGGWHFTYIGSEKRLPAAERVRFKIKSAAHQELNTREILGSIDSNIKNLKDIFPRKRTRFKIRNDYRFLPAYIQDNLDKFDYLIKK